MKKRGFTLIELLAVIVILAIIALIATPIVMNTIEKSKKSAAERSADNYIDAVETAVATKRLDGVILDDGVYSIKENGNICIDKTTTCTADTEVKVEINGTKPASGSKVALTNGQVVATGTSLKIDNYKVSYNNDKLVATLASAQICTFANEGIEGQVGAKYTCNPGDGDRTFYILEVGTNDISLIMDRNLIDIINWITQEDWEEAGGVVTEAMQSDGGPCEMGGLCITSTLGPITLNNYLSNQTSGWTNVTVSLPTKNQIYNVNDSVVLNNTPWLYGNIGVTGGYWTSTPSDVISAWSVSTQSSNVLEEYTTIITSCGLRPVITISKNKLN